MKAECYRCFLFAAAMTITALIVRFVLDALFVLQMPH